MASAFVTFVCKRFSTQEAAQHRELNRWMSKASGEFGQMAVTRCAWDMLVSAWVDSHLHHFYSLHLERLFLSPHVFKNSRKECHGKQTNKQKPESVVPLQEYTWDDLTHTVSQDQTSVGFATDYSLAPLNNPLRRFLLPLRRQICSLHFNERHSGSSPRPQAVSCCKPSDFHFLFNPATFAFHWGFSSIFFLNMGGRGGRGILWGILWGRHWGAHLAAGARITSLAARLFSVDLLHAVCCTRGCKLSHSRCKSQSATIVHVFTLIYHPSACSG